MASPTLRDSIHALARDFSRGILEAVVRGHTSLGELRDLAPAGQTLRIPAKKGHSTRRGRQRHMYVNPRSPSFKGHHDTRGFEDIQRDVQRLVSLVEASSVPLKGRPLRERLGLTKDRFLRTAHLAVESGRLVRLGYNGTGGYFRA